MTSGIKLPTLTRNDWIIRFFNFLKLKPLGVFFAVALFNIILDVSLALGFDIWESTPSILGLSREPGAWGIDFIGGPLLFATYVWVNRMSGSLITGLIKRGKLKLNKASREVLDQYSRQINSVWFSRLAILLGIASTSLIAWLLIFDPANTDWSRANDVIVIIRTLFNYPVHITGMLLLLYLVSFIFRFNKIITLSGVVIEPFHPDNAGGLGEIGLALANFGYVILCFGFILVLVFYQSYLNTSSFDLQGLGGRAWLKGGFVYLLLYVIIAPSAFFLPALNTHWVMVKQKKSLLMDISRNIDKILKHIHVIRLESPSKVRPLLEKLNQLEHLREITMKYPTWPYNQENFRKYLGLVSTPFLSTFLSIVANKLYTAIF